MKITTVTEKKKKKEGGNSRFLEDDPETEADSTRIGSNLKRRTGLGLGAGKGVGEDIENEEDRARIESAKRRFGLSLSSNKGVEDRKERGGPSEKENLRASESEDEEEVVPLKRTRRRNYSQVLSWYLLHNGKPG